MPEKTLVTVLGAGRVGATIAGDLARDEAFRVRAVDADDAALARLEGAGRAAVEGIVADLADPEAVDRAVADADLVVGAVPGYLGYRTLERVVEAGMDVVDISFFEEDPFDLDALARERGATAVVDAGLAPGLSNLVLGRLLEEWDAVERFHCRVGGLPADRSAPFEYRAPFSPVDVLEEYLRPARIRRDGRDVTRPALSEVEAVEVPEVGSLEAFLTDGLRTLLRTTDVPTMTEKTLRYPGHAAAMRSLREAGFFSREPVSWEGVEGGEGGAVRPLDLTARLLTDAWRMEEDTEDLVVLGIDAEGARDGERVRRSYRLLDRYDPETGTTAMARTTGYTCTAFVRLVARGLFRRPGIHPPEIPGREEACFDFVLGELAARGVELEVVRAP
ncbi:MAG TPA: saccharopine dehydrogenase C-terminal domain-containing protein [Longimicrobiales bacterium]|nr:saccharopine dehydrogenase C-terminal domain-containing protein [Longimicrobiales bacterium]